jgi:hypothetical protein
MPVVERAHSIAYKLSISWLCLDATRRLANHTLAPRSRLHRPEPTRQGRRFAAEGRPRQRDRFCGGAVCYRSDLLAGSFPQERWKLTRLAEAARATVWGRLARRSRRPLMCARVRQISACDRAIRCLICRAANAFQSSGSATLLVDGVAPRTRRRRPRQGVGRGRPATQSRTSHRYKESSDG